MGPAATTQTTSGPAASERTDDAPTAVVAFSPNGVLIEANQRALDAVGATPQASLGKRYDELQSLSHRPEVIEQARDMLASAARGETVRREIAMRFAGGRIAIMDAVVSPLLDVHNQVSRIIAVGIEITARKDAEASLHRLNRALRMMAECNGALARSTEELDLLNRNCSIIVDSGEYRLAWVGLAQNDVSRTVLPVAWAGIDASYIENLRITWADTVMGKGPTGRAIRENTVQLCRDLEQGAYFAPWRNEARQRGYASSIALPLDFGDQRAALNIYSDRTNAFDAAEVALLSQLASDIAHGVRALRSQAAHHRAEEQLRLFRKLLEEAHDLIYLVDLETGRILDANAAVARHFGYSRDDLLQMKLTDLSITAGEKSWQDRVSYARSTGTFIVEGQHRRKDGEIVPVEISGAFVKHEGRPYLITVTRDISERKRQQAQIARLARISRLQAAVNAAILRIRRQDELLAEACRLATEVGGYDRAVVSLVDPDGHRARPLYRAGAAGDFPEPDVLEIGDGAEPDASLTERALRTGEVAVCSDLTKSEPPVAMRERLIELGYRSLVAMPLIVEGKRLGALTLGSRNADLMRDEELVLLQDMAASLSFALRAQRQADEVQLLAYFDPLTGLANRALFCERLGKSLAQRGRLGENPAVAAFDVHQLSKINDTYGRHFGDLLLQQVAARLKHHTEDDERIGYLGGGAFVLVEPNLISSEENIASLLESTVSADPFSIEGRTLRVTFRSGVARYPTDGQESGTLVNKAEAALRHAKDIGEQYIHYALDIHSEIADRIALENRLQSAIDEEQFEVYYQPQIGVASGRIESVEALLRWNDPERGLVAPAAFLSVLEASGMIVAVGSWVLNRAMSDCRHWCDLGLAPVRVAVNVSPVQIRRRTFVPHILDLVRLHLGERAGCGLDLEITETAVLQDIEGASRKLQELRDVGVRIALDDFGTGYSSLGLLPRLPVDLLKIDRSFVLGLPADKPSAALVESIVRLASAFGLVTVAEGVENEQQMSVLRDMQCDQTQGYLHCAPVPAADIEYMLARRER